MTALRRCWRNDFAGCAFCAFREHFSLAVVNGFADYPCNSGPKLAISVHKVAGTFRVRFAIVCKSPADGTWKVPATKSTFNAKS